MSKKKAVGSRSRGRFIVLGALLLLGLAMKLSGASDASIESKVVQIVSEQGSCSGEQVRAPSGIDYILTAAHCRELGTEGGHFTIIRADGRHLDRQLVAEDEKSDLLLLEGVPGLRGLPIAESRHAGQEIMTFTHGHGFATYKTEGRLVQDFHVDVMLSVMGEGDTCAMPKNRTAMVSTFEGEAQLCLLSVDETVTTAFISPGSSGGPVVDSSGRLVGVVSAGGEGYGFLVRLEDIKAFVQGY